MKELFVALRMLLVLTVLTGVLYPLFVTGISAVVFPNSANGSLARRGAVAVGSELIGQKFESAGYFWSRPSATDYNPLPSGGSNLGPTSADLKKLIGERGDHLRQAHGTETPPADLLFASASGLDPHISPRAARYQVGRVAQARGMPAERVHALVESLVEGRQFGIFGEPRVNVLKLNLALDAISGVK